MIPHVYLTIVSTSMMSSHWTKALIPTDTELVWGNPNLTNMINEDMLDKYILYIFGFMG